MVYFQSFYAFVPPPPLPLYNPVYNGNQGAKMKRGKPERGGGTIENSLNTLDSLKWKNEKFREKSFMYFMNTYFPYRKFLEKMKNGHLKF